MVESRLGELGIQFEFFAAIDAVAGEHLKFPRFPKKLRSRYGYRLTPGEAGCFASHAMLWEACATSGHPMLILEDNVHLEPGFPRALAAAAAELEHGTEFVRLNASYRRRYVPLKQFDEDMQLVRYLKGPRGSTAYALSPEGARRLLDGVKHWAEPLDDYLDRFWVHGLPPLVIHPVTARRADVPTEIPGRKPPSGLSRVSHILVANWDGLLRQAYNHRVGLSRSRAVMPERGIDESVATLGLSE
ncbi:MAG: hypothetical protein JWQ89_2333 [Devosia sp.]|nr:hypothetical protein [Devosia sp.]